MTKKNPQHYNENCKNPRIVAWDVGHRQPNFEGPQTLTQTMDKLPIHVGVIYKKP